MMKLYFVSDDSAVLEYWEFALHSLKPIFFSSLADIPTNSIGIVFILDSLVLQLTSKTITNYSGLRIMVFSKVPDFLEAQSLLRIGVMGYGNAMMHETHLKSAFQALEDGKVWLYPDFVTKLMLQIQEQGDKKRDILDRLSVLTPREREIAQLLNDGKSHLEISETLGITVRTIKAHSSAIYEKLGVKDRLSLSLLLHS